MTGRLWQSVHGASLTVNGPFLFLRNGDTLGGTPRGMNLTARDARSLAESLIVGAAALENAMSGRCACGEPIEEDDPECVSCTLERVRDRRSQIRVL